MESNFYCMPVGCSMKLSFCLQQMVSNFFFFQIWRVLTNKITSSTHTLVRRIHILDTPNMDNYLKDPPDNDCLAPTYIHFGSMFLHGNLVGMGVLTSVC